MDGSKKEKQNKVKGNHHHHALYKAHTCRVPSASITTPANAAPSVTHQAKLKYQEARPARAALALNGCLSPLGTVEPVRAGHRRRIRICAISKLTFGMPGSNKSTMVQIHFILFYEGRDKTRRTILHREQYRAFCIFFPSTLLQFAPSHRLYRAPFDGPILAARSISACGRLSRPEDIYSSMTAFHRSIYSRQSRLLILRPCDLALSRGSSDIRQGSFKEVFSFA